MVAGSWRTPGVRSRAKARRNGRLSSVWRSEGSATFRVGPSSLIVRSRFAFSVASAPVTVLKLLIKPWSCASWPTSASKILAWPAIRPERSCGSVPRSASLTMAESFAAVWP